MEMVKVMRGGIKVSNYLYPLGKDDANRREGIPQREGKGQKFLIGFKARPCWDEISTMTCS
jgi:hypothetical protein